MSELHGRVVAITGAARGMGRAYTKGFLAQGAKVIAMDQSWEPTGFSSDADDSFLKELAARPDDAMVATVDICDEQQIKDAYETALNKFGTIDVLINNAGMRQRDLFPPTGRVTTLETNDADWDKMFGVTVISSGALHHSHGGAYVALRPDSREMPYQSAKAALLCMMFYLADEVKERNVAVNILVPGHARTTGYDEQNAARRARRMSTSGQQSTTLIPEHIVPLALFLAKQDAATAVTGKCFDTVTWNIEHGFGGPSNWVDPKAVSA